MSNSWDPTEHSPPGSSVHGTLQARMLERVAVPSSKGPAQPRGQTSSPTSPALAAGFFTTSATCPFRAPPFTGSDWHGNKLSQLTGTKCQYSSIRMPQGPRERRQGVSREIREPFSGGDRESQVGLWEHPTPQDEGKGLHQRG